MKKNILFLYTALLFGTVFISCEKDKNIDDINEKQANIIGKWQLIKYVESESSDPDEENMARLCAKRGWYCFNNDGTYENYSDCNEDTTFGTWSITSDNYLLYDGNVKKKIRNLNNNILEIEDYRFPDGYYMAYYWTYEKIDNKISNPVEIDNPYNDLIVGSWNARYAVSGQLYRSVSETLTFNVNRTGNSTIVPHFTWGEGTAENFDFKWEILNDTLLVKVKGDDYSIQKITLIDYESLKVYWYNRLTTFTKTTH